MILTLITNLAFALVAMILGVLAEISLAVMGIARLILALVTSPYFINLPYTSGGIIDVGWPIVRDFANLGFALALLWIGLATALKLSEYEAKKTLPRLILMILLVNFSPVICGVVVDAANIVMNFFLGAIGDWTPIWNFAKSIVADVFNIFTSKFFTEPVSLEAVARASIIIVFCELTGFFFLLYAMLFIVRYVAIWVLVILSPLAFFAFTFSKTSSYWKQWWNQFIQWTIIGIPASFFLYLSYQILDKINTTTMPPPPPDFWGDFIGLSVIMNQVMIFMPVLVLLLFGFMMSLSSGAMGANAIISTGKKLNKAVVGDVMNRAQRGFANSKWGRGLADNLTNKTTSSRLSQKIGGLAEKMKDSSAETNKWYKKVGYKIAEGGARFGEGIAKAPKVPGVIVSGYAGRYLQGQAAQSTKVADDFENRKDVQGLIKAKNFKALMGSGYYGNPLTKPEERSRILAIMAREKSEEGFDTLTDMGFFSEGMGAQFYTKEAVRAYTRQRKDFDDMVNDLPSLANIHAIQDLAFDPVNKKDQKVLMEDILRMLQYREEADADITAEQILTGRDDPEMETLYRKIANRALLRTSFRGKKMEDFGKMKIETIENNREALDELILNMKAPALAEIEKMHGNRGLFLVKDKIDEMMNNQDTADVLLAHNSSLLNNYYGGIYAGIVPMPTKPGGEGIDERKVFQKYADDRRKAYRRGTGGTGTGGRDRNGGDGGGRPDTYWGTPSGEYGISITTDPDRETRTLQILRNGERVEEVFRQQDLRTASKEEVGEDTINTMRRLELRSLRQELGMSEAEFKREQARHPQWKEAYELRTKTAQTRQKTAESRKKKTQEQAKMDAKANRIAYEQEQKTKKAEADAALEEKRAARRILDERNQANQTILEPPSPTGGVSVNPTGQTPTPMPNTTRQTTIDNRTEESAIRQDRLEYQKSEQATRESNQRLSIIEPSDFWTNPGMAHSGSVRGAIPVYNGNKLTDIELVKNDLTGTYIMRTWDEKKTVRAKDIVGRQFDIKTNTAYEYHDNTVVNDKGKQYTIAIEQGKAKYKPV